VTVQPTGSPLLCVPTQFQHCIPFCRWITYINSTGNSRGLVSLTPRTMSRLTCCIYSYIVQQLGFFEHFLTSAESCGPSVQITSPLGTQFKHFVSHLMLGKTTRPHAHTHTHTHVVVRKLKPLPFGYVAHIGLVLAY